MGHTPLNKIKNGGSFMKSRFLKRFLSILLVLVVMASMFVGCGKSSKQTAEEEPTVVAEEPTQAVEEPTLNSDEPGWKQNTEEVTLDWFINYSWFAPEWGTSEVSKMIMEKTGVNINFIINSADNDDKLNAMIASGTLPDIITLDTGSGPSLKMIEGGLVYPLNELADQYDPYFYKAASSGVLSWHTQADGNVYGYPNFADGADRITPDLKIASTETFCVKKDMYEAIGSPDMSTPEGFLNALVKANEMFGTVDGQSLIPIVFKPFTLENGSATFDGYFQDFLAIPYEKDGKMYDRTTDPEFIKWMKTLRTANEMGLISTDVFIDQLPQIQEKIAQGRYFAVMINWGDWNDNNKALYAQDPNSVYIAIDGPANSEKAAPTLDNPLSPSGWMNNMITKNCKYPEKAIQFFTYMISEEGQHDMFLGKQGVTYDIIDGTEQFLPSVIEERNADQAAFEKKYGAWATYYMFMSQAYTKRWEPIADPPTQIGEWAIGKAYDSMAYRSNVNPDPASEEGIALTAILAKWAECQTNLILASSEAEFDQVLETFIQERNELGWEKIIDFRTQQMNINKEKLGMK